MPRVILISGKASVESTNEARAFVDGLTPSAGILVP